MGILGDLFTGLVGGVARQMERNAGTAHRAAQSGMYNGRKLSEQGREKMRFAENRNLDAAERARNIYETRKANEGK